MTCNGSLLLHDYENRVSYPYREPIIYDNHDNFTTRGQHKLYSDSLLAISRTAEFNVDIVKQKLMAVDPCRAYGLRHWHPESPNLDKDEDCFEYREGAEWPRWGTQSAVFTTGKDLTSTKHNTEDGQVSKDGVLNKLCYLCTTLEEHQQHIAKRGEQLKAKKKPKPRIRFIPPPPIVKLKEKVIEEKNEILYKFAVTTANVPNADTSANVTVKMKGEKGIMRPRPLKKKIGVNYVFGRGTTEIFYIKGPNIGDLKLLAVEHDGLEKRHAWFLDHIEVTNMMTEQMWFFPLKNWISLFHGDYGLKKVLQGHSKDIELIEYEVTVVTGDLVMAGTSANVYITIYGKKGVGRKQQLKNKNKSLFERGNKDKFYVTAKENILPVTKIRIEHDNAGAKPQWFVEKVLLHDLTYDRGYKFPCGRWLAQDKSDGKTFVDLYPVSGRLQDARKSRENEDGKIIQGPTLKYELMLLTGTERYGGTDAHVYIQLFGKRGKSTEIELNEGLDHFEQGQTDEFKIRLEDVGDIKRILVRHDNTGLGAGWFLEKMTIRRFFSTEEIHERKQMMSRDIDETVAQRASEAGLDVDLTPRKSLHHEESHRTDKYDKYGHKKRGSSRDSDSDSLSRSRKHDKHGHKKRGSSKDSDSDSLSRDRRHKHRGQHSDSDSDRSKKSRKTISWKGLSDDEYDPKSRRKGQSSEMRARGKYYDSDSDNDGRKKRRKSHGKQKHSKYDSSDSDSDVYYMNKKDKKKNKQMSKHSDNSDSDTDSDPGYRRRQKRHGKHSDSHSETETESESGKDRKHKGRGRRYSLTSEASETAPATSVWKETRIPYFDEYLFMCHRWLATDEDDGQIEREFRPKTVTTFFKIKE